MTAVTLDWTLFYNILGILMPTASVIYTFVATRRKDVDKQFDEIGGTFKKGSDRMDGLERRIQTVEQTVAGMPAKSDLHELALVITEMGGDMKALRANMKAIAESMARTESIVSRHEDYLREKT
jgi:uncharacterized coiled-coil protein SlyX